MCGHTHNSPCPIFHEDIVGYPDGNPAVIDRIDDVLARKYTFLLCPFGRAFHHTLITRPFYKVHHGLFLRRTRNQFADNRMLRRQGNKGHPVERVRTRGKTG